MVKNSNISKDRWLFSKGHIKAMLTIGSHQCKLAVFHFFIKVIFCNNSAVILLILNVTMKNIENHEMSIVQKPL